MRVLFFAALCSSLIAQCSAFLTQSSTPSLRSSFKPLASSFMRYNARKTVRYMAVYDGPADESDNYKGGNTATKSRSRYPYTPKQAAGEKEKGPLDGIPEVAAPLDLFFSTWKLDISIVPVGRQAREGEEYSLQFPLQLNVDGTVTVFETGIVKKGIKWSWELLGAQHGGDSPNNYLTFVVQLANLEVVPSGKYYFNADIQGDDEVGYTLSNGFLRTKVAYVRSQDGVPQSASAWVNAGTFTMKPIAEMPYELYDAPRP